MTSPTPPADGTTWSLPRGVIVLLGLAGGVVTVAGLQGISGLLGPVFLALMLTVAVNPIQGWAERRGWPRWLAVVLALLTVYLILLGLALALVISAARLATLLPTYADQFDELVDQAAGLLEQFNVGQDQVETALGQLNLGNVFGVVQGFLSGVLGVFSNLFFVLAVLLFMGLDAAGFPARLKAAAAIRPDIVWALTSFARGTRRYFVVSTVFGLIVAVFDTIALALLGIPLPALWGLLAFITNYIPNIGFVIGLIPPALLGLLQGGWQLALTVVVIYSAINFVIQSIIQPKFVGDAVGLSTTLTFLSLVFWTWVIGPLGALLAIPLSLLTKAVLIDIDPSTRWVSTLVSSGDVGTGPGIPVLVGASDGPDEPAVRPGQDDVQPVRPGPGDAQPARTEPGEDP